MKILGVTVTRSHLLSTSVLCALGVIGTAWLGGYVSAAYTGACVVQALVLIACCIVSFVAGLDTD